MTRQLVAVTLCALLVFPVFSPANAAPLGNSAPRHLVGVVFTYDYDAFGNLLHSTGISYNNYLFAGEQFDPDLGLYYNRARYLNVSTG
ncbi:MAG TPA: hypothetical protein VEI73_14920, partial [Candidatus Acidoferrum sp.]|nr:hypothetical protein [Candidatus Acidoferrum sp.]